MLVRFWGVRGSVPWSHPGSSAFGCNTPCIELRDEESERVLILDAGTGLVGLSGALGERPAAVAILLSHYHWDHVQGLPFFAPFFEPGRAVTIWAPPLENATRRTVECLFEAPHFPVQVPIASPPDVREVLPGAMEIGGFHVLAAPLHHPGGSFAYRIRGASSDLVYATDHEFGNAAADESLASFAVNSGATVLDAHFTPDELPMHAGWGHSSWRQSTEFASATGAGHLWLFHHKPGRSDAELEEIEARARRVYPACRVAREGDTFRL